MFFRTTKKAPDAPPPQAGSTTTTILQRPSTTTTRANATSSNPGFSSAGGKRSMAAAHFASTSGNAALLHSPSLKSVPPGERAQLFQSHLALVQQMFNFNDPSAQVEEKEAKRLLLLGLVDHINANAKDVFSDQVFPDVMAMLSANLFRDLPGNSRGGEDGEEEDEPALEPAWPHLQIVYEFLLRFVVSADVDAKVAKKYISQPFISQLLELFTSEDPREREYLKTILHRIYGKYMGLRAFIRRAINYVFFRVMYEGEKHNGIGELLEILGSIINGFALPLKAEHKRFLVRALIPLHKVRDVAMFHNQLSYCVNQFVEKDPKMIEPIVGGILRFWPHASSPKQILFLNELEDLLELCQPSDFTRICVPLFERINECISSPHFQVCERALFLWNNEYLVSLINQNRALVLPLVISTLTKNSTQHWNATVCSLTGNVAKLFQEMDRKFYFECKEQTEAADKARQASEQARIAKWNLLEKEARASRVL